MNKKDKPSIMKKLMHFKDAVSKGKNRERARRQQKDKRAEFMTEKNNSIKKKRGRIQHIRGSPKKRKIFGKAVFFRGIRILCGCKKNLITDKAE